MRTLTETWNSNAESAGPGAKRVTKPAPQQKYICLIFRTDAVVSVQRSFSSYVRFGSRRGINAYVFVVYNASTDVVLGRGKIDQRRVKRGYHYSVG